MSAATWWPDDQRVATQDEVELELARRALAAYDLEAMWRLTRPEEPGMWQLDMIRQLQDFVERVEAGEPARLMIFAPPQHGKSITVSRVLPAWVMGRNPTWPIMLGSYAATLAQRHGKWVRECVASDLYSDIFDGLAIKPGDGAADIWQNTKGGQFTAVSRGSGGSGHPAKLMIIDDPFADRQEADSPTIQDQAWDWWSSVLQPRVTAAKGGVVLMHTRWSERDLAGRILEADAAGWTVLKYPAIGWQGPGLALHPERMSVEDYAPYRRTSSERDWMSIYQQEPINAKGAKFPIDQWRTYNETPRTGEVIICGDLALREHEDRDGSTFFAIGETAERDVAVLPGGFWVQETPEKYIEKLLDLAKATKATQLWIGRDHISGGIEAYLKRRMDERRVWMTIHEVPEAGRDKVWKAAGIIARYGAGRVIWPNDQFTRDVVKPQFITFPGGRWDDCVDALAKGAYALDRMSAPAVIRPPEKPKQPKRWKEIEDRVKAAKGTASGIAARQRADFSPLWPS